MSKRDLILLALLDGHKVIRLGKYSWRWAEKFDRRPSLACQYTSALCRAALCTEEDDQLVLTQSGHIVALQIFKKQEISMSKEKMNVVKVRIEDACDGFTIRLIGADDNERHCYIDQEDSREKLKEVFEAFGIEVEYVEDY